MKETLIIFAALACMSGMAVFSILSIKHCHPPRRKPKLKTYQHAAAILLGLCAFAAVSNAAEPKHFQAGEWNLDLYGTGEIAADSRSVPDLNLGAGAGLTYWATRGFGFGLRGDAEGWSHSVFDRGVGRVSVRAPLWDRIAPYGYAEGGYEFERERWLAGAGGGLDLRLAKGWGLFAEAGLETTTRGAASGRGSAGVRLTW